MQLHTPPARRGEEKAGQILNHQTNERENEKMSKTEQNEPTASADATPAAEKPREILVRFKPHEIEEMKYETGATAEATAIACFVRKNLKRKRG